MNEASAMLEKNKALAKRMTELLDKGNETQLKTLLSPNFISHFAGQPQPLNREMYLQVNRMARLAFGDLRRSVDDVIAEGDKVVVRITARGTHTGTFQGIQATGKLTKISGIAIRRIEGEQIVEEWVITDQLSLMQQLGFFRSPFPEPREKAPRETAPKKTSEKSK